MGKFGAWYLTLKQQGYPVLLISFLSSLGSGGILAWYLREYDSKEREEGYVYLSNPIFSMEENSSESPSKPWWVKTFSPRRINDYSFLQLVSIAKSSNSYLSAQSIKRLSSLVNLEDYQCLEIAQALDLKLAIKLARLPETDLRFYLPPPEFTNQITFSIEDSLCSFLENFNLEQEVSKHGKFVILKALSLLKNEYEFKNQDVVSPWVEIDVKGSKLFISETKIVSFLEALIYLTQKKDNCQKVVKWNVLELLFRCLLLHSNNILVKNYIGQILGNLSCHPQLHGAIFQSGWIGKLAEWSRKEAIEISLPAIKVLINMDRSQHPHIYPQGIYVAYPKWSSEISIKVDIIFVHGFYGSAFKSWRQRDRPPTENFPEKETSILRIPAAMSRLMSWKKNKIPTSLWPQDWLSEEFHDSRILLIDYPTSLTQWKGHSESNRIDLNERSEILLGRLREAGVGSRPIIWISHSMGGLLVKNIIHLASCSETSVNTNIVSQSKGIIFYGVPHHGCNLAKLNPAASAIIQPSLEIKDLRPGSSVICGLQNKFLSLASKHKFKILSFGETEEIYLSKKLKLKTLLVPPESADPGIGSFMTEKVNHVNICKPESRDSLLYSKVVDLITEITEEL